MAELFTPHEGERQRVFICYSTADRQRVEGLTTLMEALGHSVFTDYRSILPGTSWRDSLEEALQAADVLLVFWTRHAAQSAWVRREYESFDTRFPDRPLVPVLGDTTPLPERLLARQYSDLRPENLQLENPAHDTKSRIWRLFSRRDNPVRDNLGVFVYPPEKVYPETNLPVPDAILYAALDKTFFCVPVEISCCSPTTGTFWNV